MPSIARRRAPDGWLTGAIAGCARGVLAGERRALCTLLAARFGPLPAAARDRIAGCDRLTQLDAWIRRAATAADVDAIFAEADDDPGPAEQAA